MRYGSLCVALLAAACGSSSSTDATSADAASTDATSADAGSGDGALDAGGDDAGVSDAGRTDAGGSDAAIDGGASEPRLIALSRDGKAASLDIASPWLVREEADYGATIFSVRCRGARCFVVHPSPIDRVNEISALDLTVTATIVLDANADPRDIAIVDDHTAVISQYGRAELLEVDLTTLATTPIDLSSEADADGLPEALMLASCGRRVFAQLQRIDHTAPSPASVGGRLAVIDLDQSGPDRLVKSIDLLRPPSFDMTADCTNGHLYIVEPKPLMEGGSGYEDVDLATLTATDLPLGIGAEAGGFVIIQPDIGWIISHTEFGPGPSSHLNWFGPGEQQPTHNTFADEHVDNLVFDRVESLLFFPDPCTTPLYPECDSGIHVFHALDGTRASAMGVDLGFEPIEVEVAR